MLSFIAMGYCSQEESGPMKFDFIIPWAAFWGVVGGIFSWAYANFARVSDARRDKLAKIRDKILQAHQAVKSIADGNYSREEFDHVRKKFDMEYKKYSEYYRGHGNTGMYDEEGLMFAHHFEQSDNLFSELRGLRSSAHLYFGEDVLNIIEDLHDIIESLGSDIGTINSIAGDLMGSDRENQLEILKKKQSIKSLSWGKILTGDEDEATKKRLDKFMGIPGRIDKVLSKYALKK